MQHCQPVPNEQQIKFVKEDEDPELFVNMFRRGLNVAISDQARIPDAHLERFITLCVPSVFVLLLWWTGLSEVCSACLQNC